jgi:hypothetical protein
MQRRGEAGDIGVKCASAISARPRQADLMGDQLALDMASTRVRMKANEPSGSIARWAETGSAMKAA